MGPMSPIGALSNRNRCSLTRLDLRQERTRWLAATRAREGLDGVTFVANLDPQALSTADAEQVLKRE